MSDAALLDAAVRAHAFRWLEEQVESTGDVLPWDLLSRGFQHDGARVPLLSQQGIFKPAVCRLPLSIRTSARGPYDDHFQDELLLYRYRGQDPGHYDNAGLRRAMQERVPLVYFHGVVEGRYLAVWPVTIVGDEPQRLRFLVQAESAALELGGADLTGALAGASATSDPILRAYATRLVQYRLHQRGFRERVIDAYRDQCAMCRLRHRDLLDAAHIVPDSAGGTPEVSNGLSLCKIHHAAFDQRVLGVRPDDGRIQVRADVLLEIDGPMLKHGLQALHDQKLYVPRAHGHKPDPERLRWHWERFQQAS